MSPTDTPESIRTAHLSHEASVKSIGTLYYIGAVMLIIGAIALPFDPKRGIAHPWLIATLLILLGVVYFKLGQWFRALQPKARTPGTILAAFGLLGFPLGTLINAYVLYLIHSAKGKVVFSEEYQAVVAATPGIKYKTSLLVWIFIGLLIFFVLAAILAALFAKK